jgi:hypothetical protein
MSRSIGSSTNPSIFHLLYPYNEGTTLQPNLADFLFPILKALDNPQRILVAGAGGGFDVFTALPFFEALRSCDVTAHLASYSFSGQDNLEPARIGDHVFAVRSTTPKARDYFPEKHLAEWWANQGRDLPVFAFRRTGVIQLVEGYAHLIRDLDLDTIILVDGGTDSLLTGDEMGLGTPEEDAVSLVAVHQLPIRNKLLLSLGFGVDHFHGVSHGQVLHSMAALTASGACLGAISLLREMSEVKAFDEALNYATERMPHHPSIVNHSILAALRGEFGSDIAIPHRRDARVWINPLMTIAWAFSLDAVVSRLKYAEMIQNTHTLQEVGAIIRAFQRSLPTRRAPETIPI